MPAIVPSYVQKVSRAEKHLQDLEAEIERYAARNPYAVRDSVERNKKIRRLVFISDPANTGIPIVAADAIYNLRSALDHLMSSLVPSNKRSSVMFPIYWKDVWEPAVEGENPERAKHRQRWASDTASLPDEAIALLKRLQPADDARDEGEAHLLQVVNRLSNRDRHEKLPVVAAGLSAFMLRWSAPEGVSPGGIGFAREGRFLKNDAKITNIPDSAVDVQIAGTPTIGITVAGQDRHIELPSSLRETAVLIKDLVIPQLARFVQA